MENLQSNDCPDNLMAYNSWSSDKQQPNQIVKIICLDLTEEYHVCDKQHDHKVRRTHILDILSLPEQEKPPDQKEEFHHVKFCVCRKRALGNKCTRELIQCIQQCRRSVAQRERNSLHSETGFATAGQNLLLCSGRGRIIQAEETALHCQASFAVSAVVKRRNSTSVPENDAVLREQILLRLVPECYMYELKKERYLAVILQAFPDDFESLSDIQLLTQEAYQKKLRHFLESSHEIVRVTKILESEGEGKGNMEDIGHGCVFAVDELPRQYYGEAPSSCSHISRFQTRTANDGFYPIDCQHFGHDQHCHDELKGQRKKNHPESSVAVFGTSPVNLDATKRFRCLRIFLTDALFGKYESMPRDEMADQEARLMTCKLKRENDTWVDSPLTTDKKEEISDDVTDLSEAQMETALEKNHDRCPDFLAVWSAEGKVIDYSTDEEYSDRENKMIRPELIKSSEKARIDNVYDMHTLISPDVSYYSYGSCCHGQEIGLAGEDRKMETSTLMPGNKAVRRENECLKDKGPVCGNAGHVVISNSGCHNLLISVSACSAEGTDASAVPQEVGIDKHLPETSRVSLAGNSTVPVGNTPVEDGDTIAGLLKLLQEEKMHDTEMSGREKEQEDGRKAEDENEHTRKMLEPYLNVWNIPPQMQQSVVFMLRGEQQLVHTGFENEMRRLATFYNFQAPQGIYVIRLANAGFFLPTNSCEEAERRGVLHLLLECAFCGVAVAVAKFVGRRPADVHKEANPNCPFILGHENRNVSVAQVAQASGTQFLHSYASSTDRVSSSHGGTPSSGGQSVLEMDAATTSAAGASSFPVLSSGPIGKDGAAEKFAHLPPPQHQSFTVAHVTSPHPQTVGNVGETVADARAVAPSQPPSVFPTPPLPRQTATVAPPPTATRSAPMDGSSAPAHDDSPAGNNSTSSDTTTQPSSSPPRDTDSSAPSGQGGRTQERQVVTYEQLGIFAQRPKRPDMAVTATRYNTFEGWPHNDSHAASEMAEAGFYYTGHADLVRCFFCKGGLKTWEQSDRPWVEHGRWFPRCPFVRLCKGQRFVDAIQKLNEAGGRPTIALDDVKREMARLEEESRSNRPSTLLPASTPNPTLQADSAEGAVAGTVFRGEVAVGQGNDVEALSRRLEEENQEMRETTLCKMCQTREVNVLFLPCGHLVACAHCAPALRTCAMCRQAVKGSVRVHLDEEETADE